MSAVSTYLIVGCWGLLGGDTEWGYGRGIPAAALNYAL